MTRTYEVKMRFFGISIGIDRSLDENSLADVTSEERDRYLAWWRRFKLLDRLNWLGIGLFLASFMGFRHQWSREREHIALLAFVLFFVTKVWLYVLTCPRCGATYSGGLITVFQRFSSLIKCYGCDLSQSGLRALERRGY
jgi:hypothetical protein